MNRISPNNQLPATHFIELANEANLMQENSIKLKIVIEQWLKILKDGNEKYTEFEATRK